MKTYTTIFVIIIAIIYSTPKTEAEPKDDAAALSIVKKVLSEGATKQIVHEAFSAVCFNRCWTLIDKADRTPEDVEDMIALANASLWHWKQRADCEPENLSIAYWQLSRVYALAGHAELATIYGKKCEKVSLDGKLSPFFIGYAYEALARSAVLSEDYPAARDYLDKAIAQLAKITDKEEKGFLAADLEAIKKEMPQ